jgi:phosphonate transport system ATP-binding protein
VLSIRELTKRYPDGTRALAGVDLDVAGGEAVVLLGSNGSGKSTLLRCITRLLEPSSGRITLGGIDVTAADRAGLRALRRQVGVVFQHSNLVDHVSVLGNVLHGRVGTDPAPRQWFAVTATTEARDAAMAALARVRLDHLAGRRADTLSGGQRQRVAIARALAQRPQLVLADEPVSALDPRAGREVMDLLWHIVAEDDLTLVCTLHQLELARSYSRRLVGLRDGTVRFDGATGALDLDDLTALYADDDRVREVQR